MLVYRQGEILARVGIMGESPIIEEAPILKKSLEGGGDGRELYLPALQVMCLSYREATENDLIICSRLLGMSPGTTYH